MKYFDNADRNIKHGVEPSSFIRMLRIDRSGIAARTAAPRKQKSTAYAERQNAVDKLFYMQKHIFQSVSVGFDSIAAFTKP